MPRRILRNIISAVLLVCWPFSVGSADEDPSLWTESVGGKNGEFALSVDSESKRIFVVRSDNRNLGVLTLRMKIFFADGTSREIPLQALSGVESPWKYFCRYEGSIKELELHTSSDGKSWKAIGHFKKP